MTRARKNADAMTTTDTMRTEIGDLQFTGVGADAQCDDRAECAYEALSVHAGWFGYQG